MDCDSISPHWFSFVPYTLPSPLFPPFAEGEYTVVNGVQRKHGRGKYADGHASYAGDWDNDKMHGKGEFFE